MQAGSGARLEELSEEARAAVVEWAESARRSSRSDWKSEARVLHALGRSRSASPAPATRDERVGDGLGVSVHEDLAALRGFLSARSDGRHSNTVT